MALQAITFGALLTLVGLGGYFGTGMQSVTALIPAAAGGPLLVLGLWARNDRWHKHAMHAAAAVGLFGLLAALSDFLRRVFTGKLEWGAASLSLALMAVLCGLFVALCIKSFVDARRARAGRSE